MIGRRGFLGALAAMPVAAKTVAERVAEQSGLSAGASALGSAPYTLAIPHSSSVNGDARAEKIARFFLKHGFPEWKIEEARRNTRHPTRLDPDLACARSFSVSAAITMQRQRDMQRYLDNDHPDQIARRERASEESRSLAWW